MSFLNRDIEAYSGAESLVASYQEGARLLTQARSLLKRAEDRKELSGISSCAQTDGCFQRVRSADLVHTIAEYRRTTWLRILSLLFVSNRISPLRFQEVQARIQAGEVPELTVESLWNLVRESQPSRPY
jgi:hypothetical protein